MIKLKLTSRELEQTLANMFLIICFPLLILIMSGLCYLIWSMIISDTGKQLHLEEQTHYQLEESNTNDIGHFMDLKRFQDHTTNQHNKVR